MTLQELKEQIDKLGASENTNIKLCLAPTKESFAKNIGQENFQRIYNIEKEIIFIMSENTLYIRIW